MQRGNKVKKQMALGYAKGKEIKAQLYQNIDIVLLWSHGEYCNNNH
jgi:hypothetical protein